VTVKQSVWALDKIGQIGQNWTYKDAQH